MTGEAVVALLSAVVLAGLFSPDESRLTVQIDGTKGLPFIGSCEIMSGGGMSTRDAAGHVPLSFSVTAALVSCEIQKQHEGGTLRIVIKRDDGSIVAKGETSQPYGVAGAAAQ